MNWNDKTTLTWLSGFSFNIKAELADFFKKRIKDTWSLDQANMLNLWGHF